MPELELTRQAIAEIGVAAVAVILLFFLIRQGINYLNEKERRQHEIEMAREANEQKRAEAELKRLEDQAEMRMHQMKITEALAEIGDINGRHIQSLDHMTSSLRAQTAELNKRHSESREAIERVEGDTRDIKAKLSPLEKGMLDALSLLNNARADIDEFKRELRETRSSDTQFLQSEFQKLSEVFTRSTSELLSMLRTQAQQAADKDAETQSVEVEEPTHENS